MRFVQGISIIRSDTICGWIFIIVKSVRKLFFIAQTFKNEKLKNLIINGTQVTNCGDFDQNGFSFFFNSYERQLTINNFIGVNTATSKWIKIKY